MAKNGVEIFTGETVADLGVMMKGPLPELPSEFTESFEQVTSGSRSRVLYLGKGNDFSLLAVDLAPHGVIPRHSHDTDCLYLVTKGDIRMGSQTISTGGGFFVAADQPYAYKAGPDGACVVEVRTEKTFGSALHFLNGDDPRYQEGIENARVYGDVWRQHFEREEQVTGASSRAVDAMSPKREPA